MRVSSTGNGRTLHGSLVFPVLESGAIKSLVSTLDTSGCTALTVRRLRG